MPNVVKMAIADVCFGTYKAGNDEEATYGEIIELRSAVTKCVNT